MKCVSKIKDQVHNSFTLRSRFIEKEIDLIIPKSKKYFNYLDLGCGSAHLTNILSRLAENSYGIDINNSQIISNREKYSHITFKAQDVYHLSINKKFDLVSSFSFFEHLEDVDKAIQLVANINTKHLIVQIPNKYFFLDLNTYLPFQFLLPLKLKLAILPRLGYSKDVVLASNMTLKNMIKYVEKYYTVVKIRKMIYPIELIPKEFRFFYRILDKLNVFQAIPFGYIIVCKKK